LAQANFQQEGAEIGDGATFSAGATLESICQPWREHELQPYTFCHGLIVV